MCHLIRGDDDDLTDEEKPESQDSFGNIDSEWLKSGPPPQQSGAGSCKEPCSKNRACLSVIRIRWRMMKMPISRCHPARPEKISYRQDIVVP